ncbi:MAG: response regulator [Planctomycetes bacterium]|nr:response regulator [Planctomycetota bacterium]
MTGHPDHQWFSLLGDLAGVAFWELDVRTATICNRGGMEDILGLPQAATPTSPEGFIPFVHPEDRDLFRARLRAITSVAQEDSSLRFRLVRPDGRVVHVQSRSRCVRQDDTGRPLVICGVVRDVGDVVLYRERVLAIAALVGRSAGSDALSALVQSLGAQLSTGACIIARIDRSAASCRLAAVWTARGQTLPQSWPVAGSPFAAIRGGSTVSFPDGLQLAFPGHLLFQALAAQAFVGVPLHAADGTVNGCLACLYDAPVQEDPESLRDVLQVFAPRVGAEISRQDMAKDLDKAQLRLHQAEKMDALGRLAGGIAHDFNNMLAGIMGATELLSARLGLDSPHQRLVRTIMQSAERSADLTRKLLSFSRKAPVQRRQHDLRAPAEEALAILERSIDRHIAVRRDLGAAPMPVAGDPALLQAMVLNLCINACDAMPRGGILTVSMAQVVDADLAGWELAPGRYVQLTVADTGVGMDAETAARLFEPFFSTKAPGAGAGLGLAAAYGTVQEHGGAIQVDTAPGKGTTMRVRLPLLATAVADPGASRPDQKTGTPGRILLVDDEDLVRQATGELLASLGWQVVHARDGEEGIRRFSEDPSAFTLAVLDSIMPRLDGLGCFRGLRELRSDLPVVFCSGYTRDRTRTELPGEPRVAFVQKPFRLAEMVQAIQAVRQS